MIKFVCDRCSAMIEDSRTRYALQMDLFAAYDILKLGVKELDPERDLRREIADLVHRLEKEDPKRLTDQIHFGVRKDLCARCRDEVQKEIEEMVAGWETPPPPDGP